MVAIEEERFSGVDGKSRGVGAAHDFDCLRADYWNIKAHILRRLADFDHYKALTTGDAGGAFDGLVGSFHGFDGDASAVADDDGLAEIERGDFLRHFAAIVDICGFGHVRRATAQDSNLRQK